MLNLWISRIAATVSVVCVTVIAASLAVALSPTLHGKAARVVDEWRSRSVRIAPPTYGDSVRTVLIYVRGNCPACAASVPALRRLVAAVRPVSGVKVQLVTPRAVVDEWEYAEAIGLARSEIVSANAPEMEPVRTVPSIIVVDRRGRILYRHAGAVTAPPDLSGYLRGAEGAL
jgi:hypothetical protein